MSKEIKNNQPPTTDTTSKVEKRVFNIHLRAASDEGAESRTVEGYAAVFDSPSEDMGYTEIIERGAFDDVMGDDVRALLNHDANYVMARTASSTLNLEQDPKGLKFSFDMPNTTYGNDLLIMMGRGDVNQCSFAFSIKEHAWESIKDEDGNYHYTRRIKKFERLYDVSIVTYPAYPDTSVAVRSMDEYRNEQRSDEAGAPGASADEDWKAFFEAGKKHLGQ